MRITFYLIILVIFCHNIYAQVNKIKQKSSNNSGDRNVNKRNSTPSHQNNSPSPSRNNSRNSSSPAPSYNSSHSNNSQNNNHEYNGISGYNGSGCDQGVDCCLSIEESFSKSQKSLLKSKPVNPHISAFEAFLLFSQNMNYFSQLIQPKFRATYGLIGSEYRYSSLIEPGFGEYNTHDWQVLQLNLVSRREFWMRLGGGFMYEEFSSIFFQEYSLQNEVKFERKLSGVFDFRFAYDAITKTYPRLEAATRFNYLLFQSENTMLKFTFGLQYQSYYQTVNLYQLQSGIILILY